MSGCAPWYEGTPLWKLRSTLLVVNARYIVAKIGLLPAQTILHFVPMIRLDRGGNCIELTLLHVSEY